MSRRGRHLVVVAVLLGLCWAALPAMSCSYMPAVEVDDLLSGGSWK